MLASVMAAVGGAKIPAEDFMLGPQLAEERQEQAEAADPVLALIRVFGPPPAAAPAGRTAPGSPFGPDDDNRAPSTPTPKL